MRRRVLILLALASTLLAVNAHANTLEEAVARKLVKNFARNEARLAAIEAELATLPQPYLREPTGTGGFLSQEHQLFNSDDTVSLVFTWDEPVQIDAVALFPLRLFMDEIYGENLYWPGSITLEAKVSGQMQTIAQGVGGRPLIPQSLPELIEFEPVTTRALAVRCTDLPQHPYEKWHAAGFAEICIFSGVDNLAPRAKTSTSSSRQGYFVLAREFLTDGQTPLGLPELSSRSQTHGFVKKLGWGKQEQPNTYTITCTYAAEQAIDAVRIDPAIQHSYGQSFPVRFTIDLLDAQGQVVRSDKTYEDFPLRGPGLNPHFAHFPETVAKSVRLTVQEASVPVPKANAAIAFSEITALHRGEALPTPALLEESYHGQTLRFAQGDSLNNGNLRSLASASDGLTQSGKVLPLREWIEGLSERQRLMEEQLVLRTSQQRALATVGKTLIRSSLALLVLGIGSAVYLIARNRVRMRRELRSARVRIASDLHDDVGSNLGTIILHVERLQEKSEQPPEPRRLNAIYRLTRESVFGLREVLNTTAPEVGRTQDLVAYMEELAALILGRTPYTFETSPGISHKLSDHVLRKGLLLFYKESLYNAKTHAQCSRIDISLRHSDGKIVLQVKDDGQGIDEKKLQKPHTLRTLKQRAEWLHAQLEIKSSPAGGTELTLSIPLAEL
ncbi:ATP-binding protein [Pelagicoccus sp. SDUM812005]|uniref:sensor histidine kinase n=1 Tax=Pelagicoccus sp. SDUM812005 TaxID=3041257 RepID=UPI00280EB42E|nr:ATP-binding protein [Pelagicoccus sp. SDUM812005]MDQ8180251.1 histidine kinase [Pelagicoccus sp. SDUM812005]